MAHIKKPQKIVVINDCRDDNARVRLTTRLAALFPKMNIEFVGVNSHIEAAGNLVDVLDAALGKSALVLVNVAPRNGNHRWKNGSPFGYVQVGNSHIFSTIEGYTLSLLARVVEPFTVRVFDTDETVRWFGLHLWQQQIIAASQFRSFDFLPLLASGVLAGRRLPSTPLESTEIPPLKSSVIWWQDNFGNLKTTIAAGDMNLCSGEYVKLCLGDGSVIPSYYYEHLSDIPVHKFALTTGSSGYGAIRWLEIIKKGGRACDELGVGSGMVITIEK